MFGMTERDIRRFWKKISVGKPSECWIWTSASKNGNGYGIFTVANGKSGGIKFIASRIACWIGNGEPSPGNPHALHSCDTPLCCNPAHLRWGTQHDNVRDAIDRKRHINPPRVCDNPEWLAKQKAAAPRGDAKTNSALTESAVREVWRLHLAGTHSVRQISDATGVKHHVVADLCRGRSWRHIIDAPTVEELKAGGLRRGVNQFSDGISAIKPEGEIIRKDRSGSKNPRARVDEGTVAEIYRMRMRGMKIADICESLSLPYTLVENIYVGRAWKHCLGTNGNPTLAELRSASRIIRDGF